MSVFSMTSLRALGAALLAFLCTTLLLPFTADAQSAPWQQEVAYEMDVTLLADTHQMRGTQQLTYTNNSPDTLRTVYYHLYFNAFHPNSMMAERNRHLYDPDGRIVPRIFNLGGDTRGYHRIESMRQDGQSVNYTIRETVMEVELAEPILPGETTTFEMAFRSQVPKQTRRSGWMNDEGIEFSMSQWYPKIAEYDERGWHADPYVGREFYAPFGTFDVKITAPAKYTLGATGVLQNPLEVGHGYDTSGRNTYRPEDGTWSQGDSLTWHFQAEDVHDFAWAADPDYIHETFTDQSGLRYHLLYEPDVEERWSRMNQWVPALINYFSREYGDYAYPQFTVAQAGDGGMEYPMINFLTGERGPRSLLGVTAHEAAHEWFYAALGSNESDYAWIDEGFTSYATTESVAYVTGQQPASHTSAYLNVLFAQDKGLLERFNTPSDWFQTNLAYGIASYPGGEMIVEMMSYVIGEDNRDQWLRRIYRERKFDHPDPFDLEKFAEEESGIRLDWYFEQFTNTTRELDYAIRDVQQERDGGSYTVDIELERVGTVAMPQDVRLTLADGSTQWINVPLVVMHGHKPVPDDWIVTEPWPWTYPTRTITVEVPAKVERAVLDPKMLTPDANRLNNTASFPVTSRFLKAPAQSWSDYAIGWRPMATYADLFGFGGGVQARGQYLFGNHRMQATLTVYPQVVASNGDKPDTGFRDGEPLVTIPGMLPTSEPPFGIEDVDDGSWFDGIDYEVLYEAPADRFGPRATATVRAEKKLGLMENEIRFEKPLSHFLADHSERFHVSLIHQYNPSDRVYGAETFDPTLLSGTLPIDVLNQLANVANPFQTEHMLSAKAGYRVSESGDYVDVSMEVGGSLRDERPSDAFRLQREPSRASATKFTLSARKSSSLGPLTAQADVQMGIGSHNLALHKLYQLGGRSFESRWRDDAFRSTSAAFADPTQDAHLVGFGPAGPVGYLRQDGQPYFDGEYGSRMLAGRLSLHTRPLKGTSLKALQPLGIEAYSGIGSTWSDSRFLAGFAADDLVADAGFGASYDLGRLNALGRWTGQSDVLSNLKVVARFPLWVSDPGLIGDTDEVGGRWLIGVQL